ncbi:MAG TPA: hypothetical protein VEO01_22875 [Pseudonocardiaceae bacterium]|nr:hypothetical protein [Pseudonocardiaceae bacterium]
MTRSIARGAAIALAALALLAAVTGLVASSDHPGPPSAPWTDAHLAGALTRLVATVGDTVTPADVPRILVQDCPWVTDPIGLVQQHMADTEAEADAVESVLAQSGRCGSTR